MGKKLKISHNLSDVEFEEVLEKALKNIKSYQEPNRELPDKMAKKIAEHHHELFDKIINNMLKEVKRVIKGNKG